MKLESLRDLFFILGFDPNEDELFRKAKDEGLLFLQISDLDKLEPDMRPTLIYIHPSLTGDIAGIQKKFRNTSPQPSIHVYTPRKLRKILPIFLGTLHEDKAIGGEDEVVKFEPERLRFRAKKISDSGPKVKKVKAKEIRFPKTPKVRVEKPRIKRGRKESNVFDLMIKLDLALKKSFPAR